MATLADQAALRHNADFTARMEQAVANLAFYILTTEADTVLDHAIRRRWAQSALVSPAANTIQMFTAVLADAIVQGKLANCTDAELQAAVDRNIVLFARQILGLI